MGGAENAARRISQALAFSAALLQPPIVPAFAQPATTIEKSVAEKLFEDIRGEDLHQGTKRLMRWADTLPHEILISRIEAFHNNRSGEWVDLRGGNIGSVTSPSTGPRDILMRNIARFAKNREETRLRVCVTHTHISEYLRRLKRGAVSKDEVRRLQSLGVAKRTPHSKDVRGFTDAFKVEGPFGTPPSGHDLDWYREFVPSLEQSALQQNIVLDVVQSVTTALGVWYFRVCRTGECAGQPSEYKEMDGGAKHTDVSKLQARWVLYVNQFNPPGDEILSSDVHRSVVQGYESHGFKVWFIPKEYVTRLQNCSGERLKD